jgi:hypothetical protein
MRLLGAATTGDLALLERTVLPLSHLSSFRPRFFQFWFLGSRSIRTYVRAGMAIQLDGGRGRLAEAVEAVKDNGVGALHLAAGGKKAEVCEFLVEDVRVDVDALDMCGVSAFAIFILTPYHDIENLNICVIDNFICLFRCKWVTFPCCSCS